VPPPPTADELEEYEYELVGIVVHSGTAEGGHYFSLIRHRHEDGTIDPKKWIEFNDSTIKNYNPDNIETDCFGKSTEAVDDMVVGWYKSAAIDTTKKNAYCLVYEKKVKRGIRILETPETPDAEPSVATREFLDVRKYVPDHIFREVMDSNEQFLFEKNMYMREYFAYLVDLLNTTDYKPEGLAQLGTDYAIDIVAHAYEQKPLPDLMEAIKKLYSISLPACISLIDKIQADQMKTFTDLVMACTEKITRECTSDLIAFVINRMAEEDFSAESPARKFVEAVFMIIPTDCSKYWTRFNQFWDFIFAFA
jgi:ubiquitin carboxyl-terminal hydrolase 34